MRKFVKPAHPLAVIQDPTRGRRLPAEGIEVDWTTYWIVLLAREDIVVVEYAASEASPEAAPDVPAFELDPHG